MWVFWPRARATVWTEVDVLGLAAPAQPSKDAVKQDQRSE